MSIQKILVVDDDAYFLKEVLLPSIPNILKKYLNSEIESIIFASDGKEGWELYQKEHPDFVFTDFDMPYLNGKELLAKIYTHSIRPKGSILISNSDEIKLETPTVFLDKNEVFAIYFSSLREKIG